ncbi:MFS transporter [Shewanella sp.]|uniref:MFS transporter n=1 Tax=Shewanella sp. TaxID=50422 RepID=UPI003567D450
MLGRISRANAKRLIHGLALASVVVYINLYLMQGMLPMLADQFAIAGGEATLILSVTSFSLALSLLGYALLSDSIGRYKPLIVSLWLLALSNPLMLLIDSWHGMLGLRLIQGILLAAVPAIAMAFMRESLPLSALMKAGAFYIAANSFGGIIGRILGGLMAEYLSWQGAALLLTLVTLVSVAITHYLLSPFRQVGKAQSASGSARCSVSKMTLSGPWRGFAMHLTNPQLRLFYLLGGLAFMVMVNQFSFIQLHLLEAPFHWSRFGVTLIFLCYLSGTLCAYRSGNLIARFGVAGVVLAALAMMVIGSLVTLFDTTPAIVGGFLLSAAGFFLIHASCNNQVALRATGHRAKASALYLCAYYLGASLGGPFLMPFWHHGQWPAVVLGSLLLLALAGAVALRLLPAGALSASAVHYRRFRFRRGCQ